MNTSRPEWKSVRLGELAEFRNGVNYNKNSFGVGVKVVGVKDFQDYTKPKFETLEQINPRGIVTVKNILRDGDIIFVRSNGNPELIGRSLLIEKPPEDITHSAFTIRLRFNSADIYPKFFAYYFRTTAIRKGLTAYGGGTNISNLNQDILNELQVPLPDLPTQRKIAGILSAYDDLIENNLRRIKILEKMAQSLYREWFVHFRFPGHESVKFVDSPLGPIPERWEAKKVGDSFEIQGGGTPSTSKEEFWLEGNIQWYSPRDLTANNSMFIEKSAQQINEFGLQKSSAKLFPAYSVMLTSRATIGAIAINTIPSCTNQGFITCLPNIKVPLYFLFQWLKDNVEIFILHASGSTFKEISKGVFKELNFLQPESEIVGKYERSVAAMAGELLNLQRQNQTLRQTRDLLLPKLLSGEAITC